MPQNFPARTATILALAFLFSWGSFAILKLLLPPGAAIAAYVVFMFGPLAAALVTATVFDRGRIVAMLALRPRFNRWWIVAWLAPALIVGLAWAFSLLMPGATARGMAEGVTELARQRGLDLDPATLAGMPPPWLIALGALVAGGAINTFAAIGEEAGWRGYLWTWLRPAGFWRASLVTGIVWGLWHAPVIAEGHNYGAGYWGFPWFGVVMMVIFTTAMSPIHGLLRDRTGTCWAPALFHGTINAVAGLLMLVVAGGHPLLVGVPGLAGAIALGIVTIWVAAQRPNEVAPIDPAQPTPRTITSR